MNSVFTYHQSAMRLQTTPEELRERICTYQDAIMPFTKMLTRIEFTQPTGYIFDHLTGLQKVQKLGWSDEAKRMYAEIERQIEEIRRKFDD